MNYATLSAGVKTIFPGKEVMTMEVEERLCVICVWRQHCQTQFTGSDDESMNIQCPEFTRDYTIKDVEADQKLLETQLEKWRQSGRIRLKPCITISREAGCSGSEICRKLAADLNMDLLGSEIISRIAESANMSEKVVRSLGERHVTMLDNWITSFYLDHHLRPDVYFQHLVKIIKTTGEHGNAVILGRGAHYILPQNRTFRVRVIGPLEQRIENVIRNRGCSRAVARSYIIKGDNYRKAFATKYFHEDIANPASYDLVVNTAGILIDEVIDMIKYSFQRRRFPTP
jgi:cytidylate kinase